jgi:hypothetical protein
MHEDMIWLVGQLTNRHPNIRSIWSEQYPRYIAHGHIEASFFGGTHIPYEHFIAHLADKSYPNESMRVSERRMTLLLKVETFLGWKSPYET